jgi:hypothetical protein
MALREKLSIRRKLKAFYAAQQPIYYSRTPESSSPSPEVTVVLPSAHDKHVTSPERVPAGRHN